MRAGFSLSTEYITNAALTHVVGKAYEGAVLAILSPTQMALSVATSAATTATVYLLMTTGKLLIAGTCLAVEKTTDGVKYLFFSDESGKKEMNEAWDLCNEEVKSFAC